jgi:hypothetical protein
LRVAASLTVHAFTPTVRIQNHSLKFIANFQTVGIPVDVSERHRMKVWLAAKTDDPARLKSEDLYAMLVMDCAVGIYHAVASNAFAVTSYSRHCTLAAFFATMLDHCAAALSRHNPPPWPTPTM